MQTTATISNDIDFPPLLDEVEKPGTLKFLRKNYHITEDPTQNMKVLIELSSEKEVASRITQEFTDTQQERFRFAFYDDEDLLDWDAAIINPPPRPSGTIRVKLKYKGRSTPFPIEKFWDE